jgi:double-strand break repair protein MRE11
VQVEELIVKARTNWEELHKDDVEKTEMMLPLIRLKVGSASHLSSQADHQVETTGAKEMSNPVRFGQDFVGRVANPRDILQYYRRKQAAEKSE